MPNNTCVVCGTYISGGDMVCKDCRRDSLYISKMNRNKKQSKKDKRSSRKAWKDY